MAGQTTGRSPGRIARSILAVLFGVIGVIGVLASVIGVWAHRTVFDSEKVASAVDEALLNPEVNEALATFLTDQVIETDYDPSRMQDLLFVIPSFAFLRQEVERLVTRFGVTVH